MEKLVKWKNWLNEKRLNRKKVKQKKLVKWKNRFNRKIVKWENG